MTKVYNLLKNIINHLIYGDRDISILYNTDLLKLRKLLKNLKFDLNQGINVLKRDGIRAFIHRLFWYLKGKRYPHQIPVLNTLSHNTSGDIRREIENTGLFDKEWYLHKYPDVKASGIDPVEHYISYGEEGGRCPNPLFNPGIYVSAHGGKVSYYEALMHFHRSKLIAAPGAYRSPEVLIYLQDIYKNNTRLECTKDSRTGNNNFAVFMQCGSGSLHEEWLKGNIKDWDLIVNHYDDTYTGIIPCDMEFKRAGVYPGTKYTSFFNLLSHWRDHIVQYDYIMLMDDDVVFDVDAISELFSYCKSYSLDLAHPSLTNDSEYPFDILKQKEPEEVRYVNTVEVMLAVLSRSTIESGGYIFGKSISGWGIPEMLGKMRTQGIIKNAAVIDSVAAKHAKKIDTINGAYYKMLHKAGIYPEVELTYIENLYNVINEFYEVPPV